MKTKKKILFYFFIIFLILNSCSTTKPIVYNYSFNIFTIAIERKLDTTIDEKDTLKAKICYEWYSKKFENKWNQEKWDYAIKKSIDLIKGLTYIELIKTENYEKDFNDWKKFPKK